MILVVLLPVVGLLLGAIAAVVVVNIRSRQELEEAQERARHTLLQAEQSKAALVEEARAEARELINEARYGLESRDEEIRESEGRIAGKTDILNRKSQSVDALKRNLGAIEDQAERLLSEVSEIDQLKLQRLSEISDVSIEQASTEVLEQVEQTIRDDANVRLRESESDVRERADELAKRLLADTMQRISTPIVPSSAGSSVPLTERDLQRVTSAPDVLDLISELTGVVLTIKEETSAVSISASDAVKRELARVTVTELLKNPRSDVERLVRKQEQRLEKTIRDEGIAASRRSGVGRLPDPITNMLGRLQYRYSYGQNQLTHAVETAHLAAMLARELGADVEVARASGLLHDLGKAIDREVEGTHAELGGKLALESGMDPRVAHCISAHHEEVEPETTEALITIVADAMSGARPGARRESLDNYLARLQAIEAVALEFPGVEKCYAIQAGRELRVMVDTNVVDDLGASRIAAAISDRIQSSLEYPGQIKVMVIRETRTVVQSA